MAGNKLLVEEFKEIDSKQSTWDAKVSAKRDAIAKHIDNIEATLRYLVDRKVEEKYGKEDNE